MIEMLIKFCTRMFGRIYSMLMIKQVGYAGSNCRIWPYANLLNPRHLKIGQDSVIGRGARLDCIRKWNDELYDGQIIIGKGVVINPDSHIAAAGQVVIGNNVLIASSVYITDHDHCCQRGVPPKKLPLIVKNVVIEDDVWVGEKVLILKGVRVGRGAIIGGGSVVTKDVDAYTVVAGVPAKKINSY